MLLTRIGTGEKYRDPPGRRAVEADLVKLLAQTAKRLPEALKNSRLHLLRRSGVIAPSRKHSLMRLVLFLRGARR